MVEATGIRDVPSGPLLRIGDDRFLPGLRGPRRDGAPLQTAVATRLFIQLIDFLSIRRRPDPDRFFAQFLEDHRAAPCGAWGLRRGAGEAPCAQRLAALDETAAFGHPR